MVDWSLARQVARLAAGGERVPELGIDLEAVVAEAGEEVARHTRLEPAADIPPPEVLDRAAWAEVNLTTLSSLLEPVAERLGERLSAAGPLAGPLRAAASATVAAEAGLVLGYMSQRVLGQY
ncbi:MAG TPA: zinc-dependent metalloprotease, partial [Thermoleophilaceae bacterium]|nr:zinc-dependent metalloprotease [Thermoleophilaceae bacterium]